MSIIDRAQIHDRVALPGDPNLDCDIDGIRVQSVIANDDEQELLLRLDGGAGSWVEDDTGETVTVDVVRSMDAWARFPDMPPSTWRQLVSQLQQWRDNGTELWLGAAPGKVTTLIEDPNHYLFLPRRHDPAGD